MELQRPADVVLVVTFKNGTAAETSWGALLASLHGEAVKRLEDAREAWLAVTVPGAIVTLSDGSTVRRAS